MAEAAAACFLLCFERVDDPDLLSYLGSQLSGL